MDEDILGDNEARGIKGRTTFMFGQMKSRK